MRKLIYLIFICLILSCSSSKNELYKITDSFIKSLDYKYDGYGIFENKENTKITSDKLYQIMPIGRLINVKILKVVGNEEYKELQSDIKSHYKDDSRVTDVYINGAGTIMIDCRN